uniref:G-patch domain-containing protein n=1 Tax=Oryza brachyantha TaxID=4533 RepID=J3KZA7_ORYBR
MASSGYSSDCECEAMGELQTPLATPPHDADSIDAAATAVVVVSSNEASLGTPSPCDSDDELPSTNTNVAAVVVEVVSSDAPSPSDSSNAGNSGDPYEMSYDSDSDDDDYQLPPKKTYKKTNVAPVSEKRKELPPITFVRATRDDGDTDAVNYLDRPSTLPFRAACRYCYEPSPPPEPGSLASNQTVARMMERMNYVEGTGLGKHGHGIIDPVEGIYLAFLHELPVDNTEVQRAPDPDQLLDLRETRATETLQREGDEYAAARALERRRVRVRAANMRGCSPSAYDDGGEERASPKTQIIRALAALREEDRKGTLTMGALLHEFARLKREFPEAYRTGRLAYKAIRLAAPLLPPLVLPMGVDLEPPQIVASAEDWLPAWWSNVPATRWVTPWIAYFGHGRLRSVYKTIAKQLGRKFCKWGVTNEDYCSAAQWKDVMDPESWDEFVLQEYVLPRLRETLRSLKVSARLTWGRSNTFPLVMKWASLVPAKHMVPLLEEEFFGKWRSAIYRLLMGDRPPPEQATAWYEMWRELFTPELLADERVLVQLESGLDMINRAARGLPITKPEH